MSMACNRAKPDLPNHSNSKALYPDYQNSVPSVNLKTVSAAFTTILIEVDTPTRHIQNLQ